MEKIIEELIVIISKEIDAFNQLLKTLHGKQRAIVEGEIERLKKQIEAESEIVSQTKSLESQRILRTKELAQKLSINKLDPKLSEIIAKVEEKYAQRLAEQRNLLKSLIEQVRDLNKSNQFLLDYSLKFVEDTMRLLLSGNDKKNVYQKDGKLQEETGSPKILNQKF